MVILISSNNDVNLEEHIKYVTTPSVVQSANLFCQFPSQRFSRLLCTMTRACKLEDSTKIYHE